MDDSIILTKANNCIHIGISFDQNYLSPFYALLTSIFENNKADKIIVHAIVTGIIDEVKETIIDFAKLSKGQVIFYTIDESIISKFVLTGKWTSAVYYRLFFPLIIPSDVNRILYLDTDIIIINSLKELYSSPLDGFPVGAVYDNYVKKAPQLGIEEEGNYFNSGVLLIDVAEWNKQKISEKTFDYLNANPNKIRFVDQDGLNAVLINNWKKLDTKFNFMYSLIPEDISKNQLNQLIKDKVVIHFTLQRPWHFLCRNRLRYLYFNYLLKSPSKQKRGIIDFKLNKIPALLFVRTKEIYFDSPRIQSFWRKIKS